jgi:hypothetical protein
MTKYINIKTSDDEPVMIDPSAVTAIEVYESQGRGGLRLRGVKATILDIDPAMWKVDLQDVLKKMSDAGFPLVAIPGKHGDRNFDGYLSPAAVTYIDTSVTTDKGLVGANIGLEGVVYFETTGTKREDIDKLIEAVGKTGKKLLKFGPSDLKTNWYKPGELLVDPATVTRVRQSRDDLEVVFENSPMLRASFPRDENAAFHATLDYQKKTGDKRDLSEIFKDVEREIKKTQSDKVASFVGSLVVGNQNLVRISAPEQLVFVRPADFAYLSQWNTDEGKFGLALHPHDPHHRLPDMLKVFFDTEQDRKAAVDLLEEGAPVTKKPAAPTTHFPSIH